MECPNCKLLEDDANNDCGDFWYISNLIVAQRNEHYGTFDEAPINFCPRCGIAFIQTDYKRVEDHEWQHKDKA